MSRNCDKCGKHVKEEEDIVAIEGMMPDRFTYGIAPRHIACSPSRAQYILAEPYGQPDERPEYDKRGHIRNGLGEEVAQHERKWTRAYHEHQRACEQDAPWYRLCPSFMGGLPQTDCGHPECHERQKEN